VIWDGHCHAGPGDGFSGPWDTHAPLAEYLRRAAASGITRTVIFPAFHSDYERASRLVAELCAREPARLVPFAFVHAERDRGRVAERLRPARHAPRFRGIKVHRHDARLSREICEVARRMELPVLYDVAGETASVELFAREFPTVDFVIPHLGSFADDWGAQKALIDPLRRLANVHADTSGVRRFDVLEEAVRRAGPGKLVFGTDGPWLHPAVELAKIRALGLAPADARLVLGGNLARLINGRRPRIHAQAPKGNGWDEGRGLSSRRWSRR
jgi:hypothetical protein